MSSATAAVSTASRDNHLTLRRVERQHHLIERLSATPHRVTLARLAGEFGVSERTVARDVERLRHSGVPITVVPGRAGGVALGPATGSATLELDLPEIAALLASLAALGPSVSDSAASAMRKLAAALRVE